MHDSAQCWQLRTMNVAIGVGHLQAVDHHQRADADLDARAAEPQHLGRCVSVNES